MKAAELLKEWCANGHILPDLDIRALTEDSRRADRHAVMVCICGAKHDGHLHALDAYRNGCRIFVAERALVLPTDACVLLCPDTRRQLALLSCRFYGHPDREMQLVGITGTKGKTTTACLLTHILNTAGTVCGYIGTNGVRYLQTEKSLSNTTPDAVTLQSNLRDMADAGVCAAVVEVSSQALLQHRAAGTRFDTVLFTNLSPDHIGADEHPDLDHYKDCKHRLFCEYGANTAVYNMDDPHSVQMLSDTTATRRVSVSVAGNSQADYCASHISLLRKAQLLGVSFLLSCPDGTFPVRLSLTGRMNVENALLAIATAAECFGVPVPTAVDALSDAAIAGRGEVIPMPNGACAVIDYAHNGTSLRQLLLTLKEYHPHRLIVLFGSVGGRTRLRRAELGTVAAELADLCILTSDNPGTEAPEAIIADIAAAVQGTKTPYLAIPDRAEAIRRAVTLTQDGDILVLAGKGHETYQLIGREKIPFCERTLLEDAFMGLCPIPHSRNFLKKVP